MRKFRNTLKMSAICLAIAGLGIIVRAVRADELQDLKAQVEPLKRVDTRLPEAASCLPSCGMRWGYSLVASKQRHVTARHDLEAKGPIRAACGLRNDQRM